MLLEASETADTFSTLIDAYLQLQLAEARKLPAKRPHIVLFDLNAPCIARLFLILSTLYDLSVSATEDTADQQPLLALMHYLFIGVVMPP